MIYLNNKQQFTLNYVKRINEPAYFEMLNEFLLLWCNENINMYTFNANKKEIFDQVLGEYLLEGDEENETR